MTITATSELHDAWARWHDAREADLATDHGWLSLTGFHWLPDTATTLDALPGSWSAGDGGATLTAAEIDGLRTIEPGDGTVEGTITATVAEAGSLPWVRHGDRLVELVLRGGRYAIRVRDPRAAERAAFDGIPTFDVDPSWIRPGRFTRLCRTKGRHRRHRASRPEATGRRGRDRRDLLSRRAANPTGDRGTGWSTESLLPGPHQRRADRAVAGGQHVDPHRDRFPRRRFQPNGQSAVRLHRVRHLPGPGSGEHLPLAVTAGELAPVRVTP